MEKGKEKTCTLLHYAAFVLLITGFCVNVVSLFYPTSLTNGAAPPTEETTTTQQQQLLLLQDPRVLILRTENMFLLVGLHCLQILYHNQNLCWPKSNTLVNLWAFALLVRLVG